MWWRRENLELLETIVKTLTNSHRRLRTLFLLVAVLPASVIATELIGSIVPQYPDGLTSRTGSCIAQIRGYEHACDYAIVVVEDSNRLPKFIAGNRFDHRVGTKHVYWMIKDVILYPDIQKDYFLSIGMCRLNGKEDSTIIALVRAEDKEWFSDIHWARRFDLQLEKFVEMPIIGVECANESWGGE